MVLKPSSIVLEPTMGSTDEIHLEIPLRKSIIIVTAGGNNFKLIYEGPIGEKREMLLESSRWHNTSEIIARIKYYAKNAEQ